MWGSWTDGESRSGGQVSQYSGLLIAQVSPVGSLPSLPFPAEFLHWRSDPACGLPSPAPAERFPQTADWCGHRQQLATLFHSSERQQPESAPDTRLLGSLAKSSAVDIVLTTTTCDLKGVCCRHIRRPLQWTKSEASKHSSKRRLLHTELLLSQRSETTIISSSASCGRTRNVSRLRVRSELQEVGP